MSQDHAHSVRAAARALRDATAILVGAGAGMGVDSGLPDFRGTDGFWRAYPAYKHLGLGFQQLANPRWFRNDPQLAWGFYGHRLGLYRDTQPHDGFHAIRRIAGDRPSFVFTSNVDGQFQRAGWSEDEVFEIHGSIHWLQCFDPCSEAMWSAEPTRVRIDRKSFRATGELPTCPRCDGVARPNVYMFGDFSFVGDRADAQHERYRAWLNTHMNRDRLVILEFGAGTAIPSVRMESQRLKEAGATLIRVNPREPHGPPGTISFATGALSAMQDIERAWRDLR